MNVESPSSNPASRWSPGRILRFSIVGGSGIVVNQGLLMLLHGTLYWPLFWSSAVAVEFSIINNFVWNSLWTWHFDYGGKLSRWLRKGLEYHVGVAISGFLGNVLILMALVKFVGMDYRIANLIGIAVGSALNYVISEFWVFRRHSMIVHRTDDPRE